MGDTDCGVTEWECPHCHTPFSVIAGTRRVDETAQSQEGFAISYEAKRNMVAGASMRLYEAQKTVLKLQMSSPGMEAASEELTRAERNWRDMTSILLLTTDTDED